MGRITWKHLIQAARTTHRRLCPFAASGLLLLSFENYSRQPPPTTKEHPVSHSLELAHPHSQPPPPYFRPPPLTTLHSAVPPNSAHYKSQTYISSPPCSFIISANASIAPPKTFHVIGCPHTFTPSTVIPDLAGRARNDVPLCIEYSPALG